MELRTLELARPLDQYGFDSAMVVGVAAELEKHLSRVPPTLFFDCGTIGEVIECLRNVSRAAEVVGAEPLGRAASPDAPGPKPALSLAELAEGIASQKLAPSQVLDQLGSARRLP